MNEAEKAYVKDLYYNARGESSFGSAQALYRRIKKEGRFNIKKKDLIKYLQGQEVYHSHIVKKRQKRYARIVVPSPGHQVEFDSAYMPFPDRNRNKYLVAGIDAFSRKVAARAVPSLKAPVVNRAVNEVLNELGHRYSFLRADKGGEYTSRVFNQTLRRRNIKRILAFEPHKAQIIERFFRTLKSKTYKMLQHTGDHRWPRHIQDIIYSYNHTPHRSLFGLSPSEVTGDKVPTVWRKMKLRDLQAQPLPHRPRFKVGDKVKIRKTRGNFEKEYNEQVEPRYVIIDKIDMPGNNELYTVKTRQGQRLEGRFRPEQLEKVQVNAETVYRVERIVARKRVRGVPYVRLRYVGYGPEDDTWEPEADVVNLRRQ